MLLHNTQSLAVSSVTKEGTTLKLPLERTESQLIVFSPGRLEEGRISDQSLTAWKIELPEVLANPSTVEVRLEQLPGFSGGAAILIGPVTIEYR